MPLQVNCDKRRLSQIIVLLVNSLISTVPNLIQISLRIMKPGHRNRGGGGGKLRGKEHGGHKHVLPFQMRFKTFDTEFQQSEANDLISSFREDPSLRIGSEPLQRAPLYQENRDWESTAD